RQCAAAQWGGVLMAAAGAPPTEAKAAPAAEPILRMRRIVKEFPGVQALAGVDLDVLPGEVHAVVGENGAGKSTVIRILGGDPRARVDLLSVAERQTVEIARALSLKADILVMDEPTAALTLEEVDRLFTIIGELRARGVSVIYISHRLEEIFRVADRITVLRDGHYSGTYAAGEIDVEGRRAAIRSPAEAIALGIGLVPEDRKTLGLVLGMSVRDNLTLPSMGRISAAGVVRKDKERALVEEAVRRLDIRAHGRDQVVRDLSGGNQQKVVVAKWLEAGATILLLCEPTQGIDVGAKVEMYRLMVELARAGVAVVMISSEMPEVLGMSDRILVMHEGRISAELTRGEATQEKILASASGRPDRGAAGR